MTRKKMLKIIGFLVCFCLSSSFGLVAHTQSSSNGILLEVPKVTTGEVTADTVKVENNVWSYDEPLTLDDDIRYRWNSVSLDLSYQDNPTPGAGWIKIYRDSSDSEDNLLLEHGSSPLPLSLLKDVLPDGRHRILFVYIDSVTKEPAIPLTNVAFEFDFVRKSVKPQISVLAPKSGVVLAGGINHEFKIELENFRLSSTIRPEDGVGKVNIYYNEVKNENLVGVLNSSVEQENGVHFVGFDSKDIDFNKIPDSESVDLIFALTNVTGDFLPYQATRTVKTNFNGSIDVGLPRISITEPRKDRLDQSVDGNQKFLLQIDNFELLPDFESDSSTGEKTGYLQIFVDNTPLKTIWPKPEFSLNEIGAIYDFESQKTIKVQLVNPDFTKLTPEASDSLTMVYVPVNQEFDTGNTATASDTWRYVIIALVLLMIVGGILLLITKG